MSAINLPDNQPDYVERAGRWLGDLDHPFYDDERNRWVWYEASTIALQTVLLGSFLAGALAVLVTGQVGLVLLLMLPSIVASFVLLIWVQRHRAEYELSMTDFRTRRGMVGGLVMALFYGSVGLRLLTSDTASMDSFNRGFVQGAGVGLLALVGLGVAAIALSKRQT